MKLAAMKDPDQCADRCWVVVDTSVIEEPGPYVVNGHPIVAMPAIVEYWLGEQRVKTQSAVRFFGRKRDAQAAIDAALIRAARV